VTTPGSEFVKWHCDPGYECASDRDDFVNMLDCAGVGYDYNEKTVSIGDWVAFDFGRKSGRLKRVRLTA
jgi:hypothetical protein